MKFLRKIFSGGRSTTVQVPRFEAPIRPDGAFFAIGDVHGEHNRLMAALNDIREKHEDPTIVCVGDYVDRGEQSADVLRALKHRCDEYGDSFVCLMGNHEQMMLKFLDEPEKHGKRWLRYGGLQTLASFRVSAGSDTDIVEIRDKVAQEMGEPLIDWMRHLRTHWMSGNVAVVHAGADPWMPIPTQEKGTLLWGHPEFETTPRQDGIWVLHGHTIVDVPQTINGRIAIDTGAYATGRLTVARVIEGDVDFSYF